MSDISGNDILQFWFEDIEHAKWFRKDPVFDQELQQRFGDLLLRARDDQLDHWCATPQGRLALIIVLDQFSRNIYRQKSAAFAADAKALQLTLDGIQEGDDEKLTHEQRSFFYLPLMHAENLDMQELCLDKTRSLSDAGHGTDKYALSHLEIIRDFGRFPHRNEALGRADTAEEASWLKSGKRGF